MKETPTLIAYGHSWAFGTGASERERGFAALAARTLRLRRDDRAVSGSLSSETARLVTSHAPPQVCVFVLMTGLNDARLNGASATARGAYADALGIIFEAFRRAGPGALVLALEQPYIRDYAGYEPFHRGSDSVIDAYNAALREVASRRALARVVAITGWNVDTMLSADGVHPGDAGHRHLAQAVVRAALQSLSVADQMAAPRSAASALRSAGRISR